MLQWILAIIVGFFVFLLFAWIGRRLLGIRRGGSIKAFLAAIIGLVGGLVVAAILNATDVEDTEVWVVGLILGLVFTMLAIVALEVVSRPGARRRGPPRLPNPVGAIRRRIAVAKRSAEITRIAARNGLGGDVGLDDGDEGASATREYAVRVRTAFEEAGGLFVKLGQLIASRPELVPPEVVEEMSKLQQDVAPAPRSAVEPALRAELGRPIDEVFATFDWDPLGSASIGQAYRATLATGGDVVVKVRRPDIEDSIHQDLEIVVDLARYIENRTAWGEQFRVADLASEFADGVRKELNYHIEADGASEMAAQLTGDPVIDIPRVHDEFTTERLLVMDEIKGQTLGRHGVVGGSSGQDLADALFTNSVGAMLEGQRFHADPHPGNLIIEPDGRLGLIDFGSTARLDAFERAGIADMLMALHLRDPSLLREAALAVGEIGEGSSAQALERAFARLMAEHLGPGMQPSGELLTDFLDVAYHHGITLPASISTMIRALGTLQSSLELLRPDYPLMTRAEELAARDLQAQLSPDNLADEVKREIIRLAPMLRRAPRHMDRIAGQLERGTFTVRVSLFSTERDATMIRGLTNRAVLAFLGASLGIVSAMLFAVDGGPAVTSSLSLFDVLGFIGLFAGATLIMRVAMEIFVER